MVFKHAKQYEMVSDFRFHFLLLEIVPKLYDGVNAIDI
jgi:hypothetical protein